MIRPLNDWVAVQVDEADDRTDGGLVLPDVAKEKRPQTGVVLAVGPGRMLECGTRAPVGVEVGDRVYIPKFGHLRMPVLDGVERVQLLREEEIMAVLS